MYLLRRNMISFSNRFSAAWNGTGSQPFILFVGDIPYTHSWGNVWLKSFMVSLLFRP